MTELEIALLAALVKVIDGYITPLQTRIKCWKVEGTDFFILGITNPQFEGPDDILEFGIPIRYSDKFNVIKVDYSEMPEYQFGKCKIEKLYKI